MAWHGLPLGAGVVGIIGHDKAHPICICFSDDLTKGNPRSRLIHGRVLLINWNMRGAPEELATMQVEDMLCLSDLGPSHHVSPHPTHVVNAHVHP